MSNKLSSTYNSGAMKHLIFTIFGLTIIFVNLQAQTDTIIRYIDSDFETPLDQQGWVSMPADNSIKWVYATGGNGYEPPSAYSGTKNALFYWSETNAFSRKLISQAIDLSTAKKPELSFAHAMSLSVFGQDNMRLLFRAGTSGTWDTIEIFTQEVPDWTVRTFNIKDYGTKYLTKDFFVAFEGVSNGGDGICIDKAVIEEKDIILRYTKSVEVKQINHSLIPRGVSDIPVMRVDIVIVGNTDPAALKSMVFKSLSSSDDLFATNGFELIATRDSVYKPTSLSRGSLKIGTATSIADGTVTFSNINYNLPTGLNSIWLVADVKPTAPHNSTVDFRSDANSIMINASEGDVTYPATMISPAGENIVEEAILFDSFETNDKGWTFTGTQNDFEMAAPLGKIAHTSSDPDCAYSGAKVMGTDLTVDGKYLPNINSTTAYFAVSPAINLKYYANTKLYFMKWLAFEANDHATIEVSTDTSKTWTVIWDSKNDALTPDTKWIEYTLAKEFNALTARKPWVKVRFGVIFSDNTTSYAGWNLDNFAITGNYLSNDVGITSLIKPLDDCLNPGFDSVTITVRNYAPTPTSSSLPVFFSIDGINKVNDFIPGPIPVDGQVTFTFSQPANITNPGLYDKFIVDLDVSGDEDATNDTIARDLFIQKSMGVPYLETFETGNGYWKSEGLTPTWECIIPDGGGFPPIPGSPKAWTLSPYGNYISNDTSYMVSSCYDLTSNDSLIFEMKLWIDAEAGKDGAAVEFSVDEGESWSLLNNNMHGWNWNWYNTFVASLGTPGWSEISTGWRTVRQLLPAHLTYEPKVKFRVKWAADSENSYRGVAFDNVNIYAAPYDIGVLELDDFASRCQGLNPDQLTVTIKNFGVNTLRQNDTIVVGFDFNQAHITIDTFKLNADFLPGSTIKHTFNEPVDVSTPGNYNLRAYTLIEDNPYFYNGNNDTVSLDFEVYPGPITSLPDTIQTHLPDTVMLETYYNSAYEYWWNEVNGNNTYHVQDDGWQYLKVTAERGNGCTSYDSTNVELLFYDVGAAELIHPLDDCGFGTQEYLVARIKNYGTDSITPGQKIAVAFIMNTGPVVTDTLELEQTLYSGKTVDFTFTRGAIDVSQQGIYTFDIHTSYGGDTIVSNDSISRSVEILGRPSVTLGPDITVEALSHTLDAGTGYDNYLWDNGETTQTREITESGSYWVQVFDDNQCDNFDTVYVRLKIRDIRPEGFTSPLSDCSFNPSEPVSLRIINSGTDTVPANTEIALSYQFQGENRVNGILTLAAELAPDSFATFTFSESLDLSTPGDYEFEASAAIAGDLRMNNDTMATTIYRYAKPTVDFGLESPIYVEDVSLEIEAGYSPHYTYLWQDGSSDHAYTARTSGLCHVIATDTRTSCFDRDSVVVYLVYSDVGITWSDIPSDGCTGEFEGVQVRVTNLGPSSIGMNAPIYVACDVNGERVTLDTLVRTVDLGVNASMELTLSGKVVVNSPGNSQVTFYTIYADDKKPENDTLVTSFEALPAPVIDFGDTDGILNTDLPHMLDAGAGHQAYLWQDNSTNQTFTVVALGIYSVTVTGQNDCQTTKTVRINTSSGVNDLPGTSDDLMIYPNPSNGLFYIKLENEKTGDSEVRIIDAQGKIVFIKSFDLNGPADEEIDIQHLSHGVYHVIIQSKKTIYQARIIIR